MKFDIKLQTLRKHDFGLKYFKSSFLKMIYKNMI